MRNMSNIIRIRVRSSSESNHKSSQSFSLEEILQQNICENEKSSQTRAKIETIKKMNAVI